MKLFESNNCKIFIRYFIFSFHSKQTIKPITITYSRSPTTIFYKTIFFIHFIDLYLFNIEFRSGGFVNPIPDITK